MLFGQVPLFLQSASDVVVMLFSPKKKVQDVEPPFSTMEMKKSFSLNLKNFPVSVHLLEGSVLGERS